MKKLYAILLLCFACSAAAIAQENDQTDMQRMQEQINALSQHMNTAEQQAYDQRIWKSRGKYFNIGYEMQTIESSLKSDFGVSLSWGKTYYLHPEAFWGMVKIGLDWSWLDVSYASYKDAVEVYDEDDYDYAIEDLSHLTLGMQVGPSITVNPIHHLKTSLYFRVSPTYAMAFGGDEFGGTYTTYCNLGLSVAWKVLSIGVEQRWGKVKFLDEKGKVSSTRLYFGFRF